MRLQQLCGFLNFLCRAIVPGRAFTRHLYSSISTKLKHHHHLKITGEMRMDLRVWKQFLVHQIVFCHKFADFKSIPQPVCLFSDASGNFDLGCGGYSDFQWFFVGWDRKFMEKAWPSIEYLELYGVTVGVMLWLSKFRDHKIQLFCDNQCGSDDQQL